MGAVCVLWRFVSLGGKLDRAKERHNGSQDARGTLAKNSPWGCRSCTTLPRSPLVPNSSSRGSYLRLDRSEPAWRILPPARLPSPEQSFSVAFHSAVDHSFLLHSGQHFIELDRGKTGGIIGHSVRDEQFAVVEQRTARIGNVWHISFPFAQDWFQQGFTQAANHFGRIVKIEQESADRVFSHRADAVAQHQPASLRLNRRPAVPNLNHFPRECRLQKDFRLIPEMDIVGEHEVDVLRVLPGQHCIQSIHLLREKGHPFVLNRRTVQSSKSKKKEVGCLQ